MGEGDPPLTTTMLMPAANLRFTLTENGRGVLIYGNRRGLSELILTLRALLDYENRESVVDPSWEFRVPGGDSQHRAIRIQLVDDGETG